MSATTATDYVPTSVLFTGGAGFIGSNVMIHLMDIFPNTRFVCLDKLDYCASVRNFEPVKDRSTFVFVKGDICSADLVNHLISSYKIDTVMHFAAQTHVDNSFGNSVQFTIANVVGTHNLLECAKRFQKQIRRFIHVSTDEVYGESSFDEDSKSFAEGQSPNPTNPYAATKTAAEFLVKAYRKSFNLPVIITRGNNVYGPRQYPEKLIPKFISLLSRGQVCPIHGDGTHRRSFLYVDDVSRAFEVVLKQGELGHVYNIGTQFEVSNLETAQTLLKCFGLQGQESKFITHVEDRNFNDRRYFIDHSKLEKLGWLPQVSFEDGLQRTIKWYQEHTNHWGDISSALVAHPRAMPAQADVQL